MFCYSNRTYENENKNATAKKLYKALGMPKESTIKYKCYFNNQPLCYLSVS